MGHQVYVVCPLVEESEVLDVKSATEVYDELQYRFFTDLRIGLLHGKMKPSEKDEVMEEFKNHELDILVSTTVIESYCCLIYKSRSDVCKKRMDIMEETNDGFVISEKDLEIRGPGDFFGTRQHGLPELKVANLFKHIKILRMVQLEAREIYSKDPGLDFIENKGLRQNIEKMFKNIGENISL